MRRILPYAAILALVSLLVLQSAQNPVVATIGTTFSAWLAANSGGRRLPTHAVYLAHGAESAAISKSEDLSPTDAALAIRAAVEKHAAAIAIASPLSGKEGAVLLGTALDRADQRGMPVIFGVQFADQAAQSPVTLPDIPGPRPADLPAFPGIRPSSRLAGAFLNVTVADPNAAIPALALAGDRMTPSLCLSAILLSRGALAEARIEGSALLAPRVARIPIQRGGLVAIPPSPHVEQIDLSDLLLSLQRDESGTRALVTGATGTSLDGAIVVLGSEKEDLLVDLGDRREPIGEYQARCADALLHRFASPEPPWTLHLAVLGAGIALLAFVRRFSPLNAASIGLAWFCLYLLLALALYRSEGIAASLVHPLALLATIAACYPLIRKNNAPATA